MQPDGPAVLVSQQATWRGLVPGQVIVWVAAVEWLPLPANDARDSKGDSSSASAHGSGKFKLWFGWLSMAPSSMLGDVHPPKYSVAFVAYGAAGSCRCMRRYPDETTKRAGTVRVG
jgi:hypothetical protein